MLRHVALWEWNMYLFGNLEALSWSQACACKWIELGIITKADEIKKLRDLLKTRFISCMHLVQAC
jgi:hypothetical protein